MASEECKSTISPCHCGLLRQASRHLSQYYDAALSSTGYKVTQILLLSAIDKRGDLPPTMGDLAEDLTLDPTTVGRNLRPLQRDGLVQIVPGKEDARRRRVQLTSPGLAKLTEARQIWTSVQERFEASYGEKNLQELRALLLLVTTTRIEI